MPSEFSAYVRVYFEFGLSAQQKQSLPKIGYIDRPNGWVTKVIIAQYRACADVIWLEHDDGTIFRKVCSPFNEEATYRKITDQHILQEFFIVKLSASPLTN